MRPRRRRNLDAGQRRMRRPVRGRGVDPIYHAMVICLLRPGPRGAAGAGGLRFPRGGKVGGKSSRATAWNKTARRRKRSRAAPDPGRYAPRGRHAGGMAWTMHAAAVQSPQGFLRPERAARLDAGQRGRRRRPRAVTKDLCGVSVRACGRGGGGLGSGGAGEGEGEGRPGAGESRRACGASWPGRYAPGGDHAGDVVGIGYARSIPGSRRWGSSPSAPGLGMPQVEREQNRFLP